MNSCLAHLDDPLQRPANRTLWCKLPVPNSHRVVTYLSSPSRAKSEAMAWHPRGAFFNPWEMGHPGQLATHEFFKTHNEYSVCTNHKDWADPSEREVVRHLVICGADVVRIARRCEYLFMNMIPKPNDFWRDNLALLRKSLKGTQSL